MKTKTSVRSVVALMMMMSTPKHGLVATTMTKVFSYICRYKQLTRARFSAETSPPIVEPSPTV